VVCDPHSSYQKNFYIPGYDTQQSHKYFTSVSEQYLPENGDKIYLRNFDENQQVMRSHIPSQSAAAVTVLI
jgi:hypothetical protein